MNIEFLLQFNNYLQMGQYKAAISICTKTKINKNYKFREFEGKNDIGFYRLLIYERKAKRNGKNKFFFKPNQTFFYKPVSRIFRFLVFLFVC